MGNTGRAVGRTLLALSSALALVVVFSCSSTSSSSCADPASGQELCGTCGSQCYYCASGTCPADPCTDSRCDGTKDCAEYDSKGGTYAGWIYCGQCGSACEYCPPGKCNANPCGTTCDGTGGNGPGGGGGGGGTDGGGGGGTCQAASSCAKCNITACAGSGSCWYQTSDGQTFQCAASCNCTDAAKSAVAHCCQ